MTSSERAHTDILGSLRSAAGKGVVRIEHRYPTDIDDLWSALTEPGRLARWYGKVEGDLRTGGQFHLNVESDGWVGTGRIQACEPPRHLVVTTRESDESAGEGQGAAPFDKLIDITLTADGGQTNLVVEIHDLPLDKIPYYGVGWQIHAESLAAHIAGGELRDREARWDVLLPPYQELAAKVR